MNNKIFFFWLRAWLVRCLAFSCIALSSGAWSADKQADGPVEPLNLTAVPSDAVAVDTLVRDASAVPALGATSPRPAALQEVFKSALNTALETAVQSSSLVEAGVASWYGQPFHGRRTASGERFDMNELTAAHKTLPLGSVVQVRNPLNGKTVDVKINDRGPFVKGRIIDLSYRAALMLGIVKAGKQSVEVHRR